MFEKIAHHWRQGLTVPGQDQAPGRPVKQFEAPEIFQMANLMTDRALGNAKLLRRIGEIQMPGGGFQGP
jgi:hypothetical protein